MKLCDTDIMDIDLKVRTINVLRVHNLRKVADIQSLGRKGFLSYPFFSYVVKLELLNYLHVNGLYFIDDVKQDDNIKKDEI